MNTSQDLMCIEIRSVAMGYRSLNEITKIAGVKILEASPAGDRFFILAVGEKSRLDQARKLAGESAPADEWLDVEIIESCEPAVLEGLFHLPETQAGESLIVVDGASVCGLLTAANILCSGQNIVPIELKIKRTGGGGYGFFTGPALVCAPRAEDARVRLQRSLREAKIECIEDLTQGFRQFFNLSGESDPS